MAQILFKRKLKSGFVLLQLLKNKASCLNIGRKSQYIYICIYIYIYIYVINNCNMVGACTLSFSENKPYVNTVRLHFLRSAPYY